MLDLLRPVLDAAHADRLRSLEDRLRAGDLRILFAGEAKRGKSTLVNALLGRELLPSGVVPVTAFQTLVRSGAPERLEVSLADGRTTIRPLSEIDRYVTQRHNAGNRRGVGEVRAVVDLALPHPEMLLVDSPGFGSAVEHNSQQASVALEEMDVAVLVLTADAAMSASEAGLLTELARLSTQVVVVLNKADLLTAAERREARDYVAGVVETVLDRRIEVLVCSGRQGLAARLTGNRPAWSASGVERLASELRSRVEENRESTLEASISAAAGRLATRQLDEVGVHLATIEAMAGNRRDELEAFRRSLYEVNRLGHDALDLLDSTMNRQRVALRESATRQVPAVRRALLDELDSFLGELSPDLDAATVE